MNERWLLTPEIFVANSNVLERSISVLAANSSRVIELAAEVRNHFGDGFDGQKAT